MSNTFTTFRATVAKALQANAKVGQALAEFQPVYDAATGEQQAAWRLDIAGLIGKAYGCEVTQRNYGGKVTIGFKGERSESARSAMRYYFPVASDSAGQSARKETAKPKADPVDTALRAFSQLSAVQKKQFLAMVAK